MCDVNCSPSKHLKSRFCLNFVLQDSILNKSSLEFFVVFDSKSKFTYYEEKGFEKQVSFGEKFQTSIGELVITPNLEIIQKELKKTFRVALSPVSLTTSFVKKAIEVEKFYPIICNISIGLA